MNPSAPHLTSDQITSLLVDDQAFLHSEAQAHLDACPSCAATFDRERTLLFSSIAGFNSASLAWSESRPSVSLHAATQRSSRPHAAPLRWAVATVALLIAALPLWNRSHHADPIAGQPTYLAAQDTEAQSAQDNSLMRSVEVALADTDPSPLSDYRIASTQPLHPEKSR